MRSTCSVNGPVLCMCVCTHLQARNPSGGPPRCPWPPLGKNGGSAQHLLQRGATVNVREEARSTGTSSRQKGGGSESSSSRRCLGAPGRGVRQWALGSVSSISQPHSPSEAVGTLLSAHCKYHLSCCLPRRGLPPPGRDVLCVIHAECTLFKCTATRTGKEKPRSVEDPRDLPLG